MRPISSSGLLLGILVLVVLAAAVRGESTVSEKNECVLSMQENTCERCTKKSSCAWSEIDFSCRPAEALGTNDLLISKKDIRVSGVSAWIRKSFELLTQNKPATPSPVAPSLNLNMRPSNVVGKESFNLFFREHANAIKKTYQDVWGMTGWAGGWTWNHSNLNKNIRAAYCSGVSSTVERLAGVNRAEQSMNTAVFSQNYRGPPIETEVFHFGTWTELTAGIECWLAEIRSTAASFELLAGISKNTNSFYMTSKLAFEYLEWKSNFIVDFTKTQEFLEIQGAFQGCEDSMGLIKSKLGILKRGRSSLDRKRKVAEFEMLQDEVRQLEKEFRSVSTRLHSTIELMDNAWSNMFEDGSESPRSQTFTPKAPAAEAPEAEPKNSGRDMRAENRPVASDAADNAGSEDSSSDNANGAGGAGSLVSMSPEVPGLLHVMRAHPQILGQIPSTAGRIRWMDHLLSTYRDGIRNKANTLGYQLKDLSGLLADRVDVEDNGWDSSDSESGSPPSGPVLPPDLNPAADDAFDVVPNPASIATLRHMFGRERGYEKKEMEKFMNMDVIDDGVVGAAINNCLAMCPSWRSTLTDENISKADKKSVFIQCRKACDLSSTVYFASKFAENLTGQRLKQLFGTLNSLSSQLMEDCSQWYAQTKFTSFKQCPNVNQPLDKLLNTWREEDENRNKAELFAISEHDYADDDEYEAPHWE